jgi:hypothetical protein
MDNIFPKREEQCPRQQITQSQLRRALERGYRESNPVPYADKQKAAKRITPSPRNLARLAVGGHASEHVRPPLTVPLLDIDI